MKKIMVMMLLLAALFSACKASSQPTDGPPTEAEIADFRRLYPVDESNPLGYFYHELRPIDPIEEPWNSGHVIMSVEIISERIDGLFISSSTKSSFNEERWQEFGRPMHYYRARINEVIAFHPLSKYFYPHEAGDIIYFMPYRVAANVGDCFLIIAANFGNEIDYLMDYRNEDNVPYVDANAKTIFYITDNSYVISLSLDESSNRHTGKSYDSILKELKASAGMPIKDFYDE